MISKERVLKTLQGEKTEQLRSIVFADRSTPPRPTYLRLRLINWLTGYDRELISLLHKYGAKARLHSHGKVKKTFLFGNIEERLFEIGTKNDVEEAVRKTH